jgi:FAD:protein FMN transferase
VRLRLSKLAAFSILVGILPPLARPVWVEREAYFMGTTLLVSVSANDRQAGFQAIESAFVAVRQTDSILSDWRDDSELTRVNRSDPAFPISISAALSAYLAEAAGWTRLTGGSFDPGVGPFIDAWDFRGAGRKPTDHELELAGKKAGLLRFELDSIGHTVRRPAQGSWIDAGGFGKGAALREAHRHLVSQGVHAGVLNFGGQILVFGDTTLAVEIAHPAMRDRPAMNLRLRDVSVSTTSQSERYLEIEGKRFGHVFDPRDGRPVPPWGSATVIHPDPTVADILSTALFVMGPDAGMRWLAQRNIAAVFLEPSGAGVSARWTPAMRSYLAPDLPRSTGD